MAVKRKTDDKTLNPQKAAALWKKEAPARAVLIAGEEDALRREAMAALQKAVLGDQESDDFNRIVFHGPAKTGEADALTPAAVFDEACTKSMFAMGDGKKLVEVRDADIFLNSWRDAIERSLPKIPSDSVVVFECRSVTKTTRLYKQFVADYCVVLCDPIQSWGSTGMDSPLGGEIERRARAAGLRLTPQALRSLMERCGENLGVLEEEMSKLALACEVSGVSGEITPQLIEEVCSRTRLFSAFDFADKLSSKDLPGALETLGQIFSRGLGDYRKPGRVITQDKEIAMRIMGAVTYKIFQLQDIQSALSAGKREFDIFREARIFGQTRQAEMRRALRLHSAESTRKAVSAVFRANMDLRTGFGPENALERMVWAICKDRETDPVYS